MLPSTDPYRIRHLVDYLLTNFANSHVESRLTIVGFSKGCAVLNQLLYDIHNILKGDNDQVKGMLTINKITR